MAASSNKASSAVPPSLAWLTVFIPAFAYFLGSRLSETRLSGRALGTLVQSQIEITSLPKAKEIYYLLDDKSSAQKYLHHGLYLVQSEGLEGIVDSVWKHDAELGRGFLLLSQSPHAGRIWRWEVGGGPIAIGKTLHMEPSGCRSNLYLNCTALNTGSGGLAIDFSQQETNWEGRLVVSEWGEGRVVRMEESGARTPLLIQVPSLCDTNDVVHRRIHQPNALLYTAFGDLIFADYDADCQRAGLYYLDNAMSMVDPLASALESRKAHSWTSTQHEAQVHVFFDDKKDLQAIGGLALDSTWTGLYVTVQTEDGTVQLLHLYLNDDDDEPLWDGKSKVVYEWKQSKQQQQQPGPLAVDQKGNVFVGIHDTVVVLDEAGTLVSTMTLPTRATSLTIGQDGFLYVTSSSDLYRIKIRNQPLKIPTNLIKKKQ